MASPTNPFLEQTCEHWAESDVPKEALCAADLSGRCAALPPSASAARPAERQPEAPPGTGPAAEALARAYASEDRQRLLAAPETPSEIAAAGVPYFVLPSGSGGAGDTACGEGFLFPLDRDSATGDLSFETPRGKVVIRGRSAVLVPGALELAFAPLNFPLLLDAWESRSVSADFAVENGCLRGDLPALGRRAATVRNFLEDNLGGASREEMPLPALDFAEGLRQVLATLRGETLPEIDHARFLTALSYLDVLLTPAELGRLPPFLVSEGLTYGPVAFLTRSRGRLVSCERDHYFGVASCGGRLGAYVSIDPLMRPVRALYTTWIFDSGPVNERLLAALLRRSFSCASEIISALVAPVTVIFGGMIFHVDERGAHRSAPLRFGNAGVLKPALPTRREASWTGAAKPRRPGEMNSAVTFGGPGPSPGSATANDPSWPSSEVRPYEDGGIAPPYHLPELPRPTPSCSRPISEWADFDRLYVRALFSGVPAPFVSRQLAGAFAGLTAKPLAPRYWPFCATPPRYARLGGAAGCLLLGKDPAARDRLPCHNGTVGAKLACDAFGPGRAFANPRTGAWFACCTAKKARHPAVPRWGLALTRNGPALYLVLRNRTIRISRAITKELGIVLEALPRPEPEAALWDETRGTTEPLSNYAEVTIEIED